MSLATLKRKTEATVPYFSKNKCFVLNMTGRGYRCWTKVPNIVLVKIIQNNVVYRVQKAVIVPMLNIWHPLVKNVHRVGV